MITLYFDGGAKPNPGIAYGSWEISDGELLTPHGSRLGKWESPFTTLPNNQAEYLTLWLALCSLPCKPFSTKLEIFSDSTLLVNQVSGRWKCRDAKIQRLHAHVLLEIRLRFYEWEIKWNSRTVNVEKFGH